MAEGFLKHRLGQWHSVESAGLDPKGLNSKAVAVMAEAGIDISFHSSDSVEVFVDQAFDYVITVCDKARESCPVFPRAITSLHWPFADPAEATGTEDEIVDFFRKVRDQIKEKIESWLASPEIKSHLR